MPDPTDNYDLNRPERGATNWDGQLNDNFETIDTELANAAASGGGGSGDPTVLHVDDVAAGDGSTDDAAAIQSAIDNVSGTAELVFGAGTEYYISETITIDPSTIRSVRGRNALLVIDGDYRAFEVAGSLTGTASPGSSDNMTLKTEEFNLSVRSLGVYNNSSYSGTGFWCHDTFSPRFIGCYTTNVEHGIEFTGRNRNPIVSECNLYDVSGNALYLNNTNLHQLVITGNHISYFGKGIYVSGNSTANVNIVGNDIEASDGASVQPSTIIHFAGAGENEIVISGNTIQDHNSLSDALIRVSGGRRTVIIADNNLSYSGSDGIVISDTTGVSVGDNVLDRINGTAISLSGVDGASVSPNVYRDIGNPGIVVDNQSSDISINVPRGVTVDDSGSRTVVNGVGRNDGDPSTTGAWNTNGYDGLDVLDVTSEELYAYVMGAWRPQIQGVGGGTDTPSGGVVTDSGSGGTGGSGGDVLQGFEAADPFANADGATGSWSVNTDPDLVFGGTQSAVLSAGSDNQDIFYRDVTGTDTIEQGERYRLPFRSSNYSGTTASLFFFVDGNLDYRLSYKEAESQLALAIHNPNFGVIERAPVGTSPPTDTWSFIDLDLTNWPIMGCQLLDADTNQVAQFDYDASDDSNLPDSGGYGFGNDSPNAPLVVDELTRI